MRLKTVIFSILIMSIVVLGAGLASALENSTDTLSVDVDDNGKLNAIEPAEGDGDTNESEDNETLDVDEDLDVGDNPYRHGALTPNEKAILDDMAAGDAAGGDDSKASQSSDTSLNNSATGNPLVVLLAAVAIIGTAFIRHKK